MSTTYPLISAEEYERLLDEPGYRTELSRGMIVREPQPGAVHGEVTLRLSLALRAYASGHDLGVVTNQTGFLIMRNPDCVRGPDVAFIRRERVPVDAPRSFWLLAPDLAIEIASSGNTLAELQQKVMEYFEAGTLEVWVIEPKTQTAMIYRSLNDISVLRGSDPLNSADLLPGFSLPLAELLQW